MATLNLTERDIDALARIAHAEAGNQSIKGRNAVAAVVINRVIADVGGFKNTIPGVIAQNKQFEPMKGKTKYTQLPKAPASTKKAIRDFAKGYVEGRYPDPTNGATFFQNVETTNKRKSNFADGDKGRTTKIGDHTFYNQIKGGYPVPVPKLGGSDFEQLGTNVSVPAARPDPKSVTPSPLVDSPVDRPTSYSGAGASAPNMLGTPAELTNFAADDIVPAGEVWNAIEKLSGAPAAALSGAKQAAGDIYKANTANTSAVHSLEDSPLPYQPAPDFSPTGRRRDRPTSTVIEDANAIAKTMFGDDYGFTAFAGKEPPGVKPRGGKYNHPKGKAADGYLTYKGKPVKDDQKATEFMKGWAAAYPEGSVGFGKGYMDGPGYPKASNIHLQVDRGLFWGRGGRTRNIDPILDTKLREARKAGVLPTLSDTITGARFKSRQDGLDAIRAEANPTPPRPENSVPSVLTPEEQEVFNTPEEIQGIPDVDSGLLNQELADPAYVRPGIPDIDSGLLNQELTEPAPAPQGTPQGIPDIDSGILNQGITEPAPIPASRVPEGIPDIDSGLLNQELTEPASVLSPQEQAVFNTPGEVDQAGSPFVTPDPAPPSRTDQLMEEILQERAAMRGDFYENMPRTQGPYTAGETPAPAPTVEGPVEEPVPPQGLPEGMGTPSAYEDLQRRSMGPPSVLSPQEQAVFGMGMPSAYEDIQRNQSQPSVSSRNYTYDQAMRNEPYLGPTVRGPNQPDTAMRQYIADQYGARGLQTVEDVPWINAGPTGSTSPNVQQSLMEREAGAGWPSTSVGHSRNYGEASGVQRDIPSYERDTWSDLRDDSSVGYPSSPTTASLGGFQDVSYEQPRSSYYDRGVGDITRSDVSYQTVGASSDPANTMGAVTGVYDVPDMDFDWGVPEAPAPAPKTRSLTPPATAPESPPEPSVGGPVRQTGWTRQTNGITRGASPMIDSAWELDQQRQLSKAAYPATPGFFQRMRDKTLLGGVQSRAGANIGSAIGMLASPVGSAIGANIGNWAGRLGRDNYTGMATGGSLPALDRGTFVGSAANVANSTERNPYGWSNAGQSIYGRDSDTGWETTTNFRGGASNPVTTVRTHTDDNNNRWGGQDRYGGGRQGGSGGDPISDAISSWF